MESEAQKVKSPEVVAAPLAARDLTCGYGTRVILSEVNFELGEGEILAVAGGSGCGKSTLLRHLVGLQEPMGGDVLFRGASLVGADAHQRREIQRRFAISFQDGALWSELTVLENVMFPLREYTEYKPTDCEELARLKLSYVGLQGSEHLMPSELSGGMRKRAALARALVLDPEILFFDEPSAGLDPVSSERLDRLIEAVRDHFGASVVIVTHELSSIFRVADRILFLDAALGKVGRLGPMEEMREQEDYPALYEFLHRGETLPHAHGTSKLS